MDDVRSPRRGALLAAGGVAIVAMLYLMIAGGGVTPRPGLAIRATLDSSVIAETIGGRWSSDRPPIELETVANFAGAFVPVPDDRHAAAWRDTSTGATLFQVTLVYETEAEAIELESGAAAGLLRQHFGLTDEPMAMDGVDSARRHVGPDGFEALSLRVGRGVLFVGGFGVDAGSALAGGSEGASDGLPELEYVHQGAHSARLAAIAVVAAARLETSLEEAANSDSTAAVSGRATEEATAAAQTPTPGAALP